MLCLVVIYDKIQIENKKNLEMISDKKLKQICLFRKLTQNVRIG